MKIILLFNFVIFSFINLNAQKVNEPFRSPEKSSWQTNVKPITLNKLNTTERISPKNPTSLRNINAGLMYFKKIAFDWQDDGEQEIGWKYNSTVLLSRSGNGLITSLVLIDTVNNVIHYKEDYYKDQFGRDTVMITSFWDSTESVYVHVAKQVSIYNPVGNELTGMVYYFHRGGMWIVTSGWKTVNIYQDELLMQTTEYYWHLVTNVWYAGSRKINEYDGNNLIRSTTLEWEEDGFPAVDQYDDSKLMNYKKSEYEYTNNLITTMNTFRWSEDEWIPEYRYTNTIWHDINASEPATYDQYTYFLGGWIPIKRYETTHTENSTETSWYRYNSESQGFELKEKNIMETFPNGSFISTNFIEKEPGIFVASSRTRLTYDDRGDFVSSLTENYDFTEAEWILTAGGRHEYTYDNVDLLVRLISSSYNKEQGVWTNNSRSDFLNYAELSVSTRLKPYETLIAYPNPTDGLVNIKLNTSFSGSLITVFDLTGRRILEKIASGDHERIDLNGLNKGMYVIRVENKSIIVRLK